METYIIQGESSSKIKLLLQLAKELDLKSKKLSASETEDIGIGLSIQEGLSSGLLNESEKENFFQNLLAEDHDH